MVGTGDGTARRTSCSSRPTSSPATRSRSTTGGIDGRLDRVATYPTGGNGGAAAPGHRIRPPGLAGLACVRPLAQAPARGQRRQRHRVGLPRARRPAPPEGRCFVRAGSSRPASRFTATSSYVLNAGGTGIVQGFRIHGHHLSPISGSARSLGLANASPPQFLTSPGQVGFTPDGRKLIVTTKASTSSIDVFQVGPDGRLSATPVVNPSATPVPFAFTFGPSGRLVAGEAGASSVTTYRIQPAGTLDRCEVAGRRPDGAVLDRRRPRLLLRLEHRQQQPEHASGSTRPASPPCWRQSRPPRIPVRSTSPRATTSSTPRRVSTAPSTNSSSGATERSSHWAPWTIFLRESKASRRPRPLPRRGSLRGGPRRYGLRRWASPAPAKSSSEAASPTPARRGQRPTSRWRASTSSSRWRCRISSCSRSPPTCSGARTNGCS